MNGQLSRTLPKGAEVLIVLMGALGDVVRGFSVVHSLKKADPSLQVTWLVEPKCEKMVRLCEGIDSVIVFNRNSPIKGILELYREFRGRKFDLTLDLQRHAKSGFFSWLSGSPRRVGFNSKNAKEFNWIFNNEFIPEFGDELPKIEHYSKFVDYLGVPTSIPVEQGGLSNIQTDGIRKRVGLVPGEKLFCLVYGSSWKSKNWFAPGYFGLGQSLLEEMGTRLVFVGDPKEREMALSVERNLNSDRVVNLVGETTLEELVGVIKLSSVCVGPDSGPGHIASSLGVPYVGLFGPTSPKRTAPYGSEGLVVKSEIGCSPCYKRRCPGLNTLCMRLINPEVVYDMVQLNRKGLKE